MVALQKADTNLDEVVNFVNNLVNCTHCHGPFSLLLFIPSVFVCVCVPFFFFVLYLRYMNERERGGGGGWRRERKKLYCNGWIHVNELKRKEKKKKKKRKEKRRRMPACPSILKQKRTNVSSVYCIINGHSCDSFLFKGGMGWGRRRGGGDAVFIPGVSFFRISWHYLA